MKTVGIIGLGTITKYYRRGLGESQALSLKAVCDLSQTAPSRAAFAEYPFYTDYKDMIERETPDCIVISTPPASHVEIASYALTHGVDVIVEKPATLNKEDYITLLSLAHANGRLFEVMYHWQNGSEVSAFAEHYDPAKITEIHTTVLDPYCTDGETIDNAKVKLMGTWIDSGVNILSMIKLWLPFELLAVDGVQATRCPKTGLPNFIRAELSIDGIRTVIEIDWRRHRNHKYSYVIYDGRRIDIDHSAQRITDGERIIDCERMERLQQHYYQYFTQFAGYADEESSARIHQFLFEVNETL